MPKSVCSHGLTTDNPFGLFAFAAKVRVDVFAIPYAMGPTSMTNHDFNINTWWSHGMPLTMEMTCRLGILLASGH